eukprot:3884365-Pyramimonas_sp.AAC.1
MSSGPHWSRDIALSSSEHLFLSGKSTSPLPEFRGAGREVSRRPRWPKMASVRRPKQLMQLK